MKHGGGKGGRGRLCLAVIVPDGIMGNFLQTGKKGGLRLNTEWSIVASHDCIVLALFPREITMRIHLQHILYGYS